MAAAVANRPVEQFETQVPIPDWQLTPEEQMFGDAEVDPNAMQQMVDENGMPIGMPPPEPGMPQQQPMVRPDGTGEPTQQWLDQVLPPQQRPQQQPQQPQPQPQDNDERSGAPADPLQPRSQTP
jgi:penicillin-binding protein 1A